MRKITVSESWTRCNNRIFETKKRGECDGLSAADHIRLLCFALSRFLRLGRRLWRSRCHRICFVVLADKILSNISARIEPKHSPRLNRICDIDQHDDTALRRVILRELSEFARNGLEGFIARPSGVSLKIFRLALVFALHTLEVLGHLCYSRCSQHAALRLQGSFESVDPVCQSLYVLHTGLELSIETFDFVLKLRDLFLEETGIYNRNLSLGKYSGRGWFLRGGSRLLCERCTGWRCKRENYY